MVAPDFKEKILFNKLSDNIDSILRTGNLQIGNLEEYFTSNPEQRKILRDKFNKLYLTFKKVGNENEVFLKIFEEACPFKSISHKNATLILMSYYFESCDIFEEPQIK